MIKILISIKDKKEAEEVLAGGGCDILDVKNPAEGTLGANTPWVIKEIRLLSKNIELAASIGDLEFKPGTASLAAYGAACLNVDYVTASMFAVKTKEQVSEITKKISKAIKEHDEKTQLIISGYADYKRIGAANPFEFVSVLTNADVIMLDTAIKDGANILDFASLQQLSEFKDKAHENGLKIVIAGSIRYPQLQKIQEIQPDILGFRGIVCENGEVKREKVAKLREEIR